MIYLNVLWLLCIYVINELVWSYTYIRWVRPFFSLFHWSLGWPIVFIAIGSTMFLLDLLASLFLFFHLYKDGHIISRNSFPLIGFVVVFGVLCAIPDRVECLSSSWIQVGSYSVEGIERECPQEWIVPCYSHLWNYVLYIFSFQNLLNYILLSL